MEILRIAMIFFFENYIDFIFTNRTNELGHSIGIYFCLVLLKLS